MLSKNKMTDLIRYVLFILCLEVFLHCFHYEVTESVVSSLEKPNNHFVQTFSIRLPVVRADNDLHGTG